MADNRQISVSSSRIFFSEAPNNECTSTNTENKSIHPAIEHFRQLQNSAPTENLQAYLSQFDVPRPIDSENFTTGVKKFITLANSHPLYDYDDGDRISRKALYGNIFLGLHYDNDLAKLWNSSGDDKKLTYAQIRVFAPEGWDAIFQYGYLTFIYKGQHPAEALDALVKGPTVIDCSLFAQMSLWFGIRYLLGNERFNQCFGRAPFFLTVDNYKEIPRNDMPYYGNPLYSFLANKDQAIKSGVTVKYLRNTHLYPFKHPGGNYSGENCIIIDNEYYIFDPHLDITQRISQSTVLNLLHAAFNAARTESDVICLAYYASRPMENHPKLLMNHAHLSKLAEDLINKQLSAEEFLDVAQASFLELTFDLHKFAAWLQVLDDKMQAQPMVYLPLPIDYSRISAELLAVIPFENKTSMDFHHFKQETAQQKELLAISKQFCLSVMANESKLVILSGKAGVGKTASAVCAAKELSARGKHVVWISEVMVHGWADNAKSMADLANCELAIDKLLATDPQAIFLDDDNLAGFSGKLLLEKIYSWYVSNPNKGLFITSNEPINLNHCYGYRLDKKYYYPPFTYYHSAQYLNWQHKTDLAGGSLRTRRDGQSIGAIVSEAVWKMHESSLENVELIPSFDEKRDLVPIRDSLRATGSMGNSYHQLRPIQQRWIYTHQARGNFSVSEGYTPPYLIANSRKFEKTTCKTIALEILGYHSMDGYAIDYVSMFQLINVLNYAHDQGGRRVILINQTSFTAEQLVTQIKGQLSPSERERTLSRLELLLCETEDSIFKHEQFNGHVEKSIPEAEKAAMPKSSLGFFPWFMLQNKDIQFPAAANKERYPQKEYLLIPLVNKKRAKLSTKFHQTKLGLFRHEQDKVKLDTLATQEFEEKIKK